MQVMWVGFTKLNLKFSFAIGGGSQKPRSKAETIETRFHAIRKLYVRTFLRGHGEGSSEGTQLSWKSHLLLCGITRKCSLEDCIHEERELGLIGTGLTTRIHEDVQGYEDRRYRGQISCLR